MAEEIRTDELRFQLDIAAGIAADLDEPAAHELAVIRTILERVGETCRENPGVQQDVEDALDALAKYDDGYIPFDQAYKTLCGMLDSLQERFIDASTGLAQPGQPEYPPRRGEATAEAAASEPSAPVAGNAKDSGAGPLQGVPMEDISSFVSEVDEYLTLGESAMLRLEKDTGDREAIGEVFRCFHNVKGISGFVGVIDAQRVAHAAESLLDKVRSGAAQFSGTLSALAFESLDLIRDINGRVRQVMNGARYLPPRGWELLVERLAKAVSEHATAPDSSERRPNESGSGGSQTKTPSSSEESSASPTIAPASVPGRKSEDYVRVSLSNLDTLIDLVGELVTTGSMVSEESQPLKKAHPRLSTTVDSLGKTIRELQELATSLRMVSLENTFIRMSRVARDLSVKSGVPVDFAYEGQETELDRGIVEEINSPLVHMIRNAVDHGLESPEERRRAGKPETGQVRLSAYHDSGTVVIRVKDDGRGLDAAKITAKAKKNGLIPADAALSDREAYQLIYQPGFSTSESVTDVSGRGVGMDVVKRSVDKLRGRIEVASELGRGTEFTVRLPLTMAIIDGMIVTVGKERFIIPTVSIQESLRPVQGQVSTVRGRGEVLAMRGVLLPLFRLYTLFGIAGARKDPAGALVVVVNDGEQRCGILVDDLVGQQQVVVKPVGETFASMESVSGAAILGDGLVTLILDAGGITRLAKGVGSH